MRNRPMFNTAVLLALLAALSMACASGPQLNPNYVTAGAEAQLLVTEDGTLLLPDPTEEGKFVVYQPAPEAVPLDADGNPVQPFSFLGWLKEWGPMVMGAAGLALPYLIGGAF